MGFNLGNFLEEAWANINPWDNGATASTVVAKRRKAAPAVTPAPNQRRVQMGQTRQPSLQLGQFSMPKISSISTTNLMSRDEQRKKNLAEIDTIQKKAKADIWDPAKIAGDIGKSVGQVASGAAKGVVDAGTGMINDYGKRVADTGEAAATVIRQLNGENQAFDKHMQDLATNANQTDINVLKRLRTESDPMRRKQLQKVLSLDARGTAINSMQNAQQQQLQATDPRKTLVNAGNTALDVLTLGKGKAILDGVRATQKVTAPVLGQLAKNTTLSGAQGAGIGAAYGGVNTAIDPNASPLDYARNMGQGAAMGAAVGIGAQVALPVAAYGAGRAVNATQKGAQVAAKAVEQSTPKAVASNHPKVVALDQHLGVLRQNYDGTPNQVARQQISKAIQVAQAERNAVYNQELRRLTQGGYQKNPLANEQQAQVATDPLQALKQEALKYKSADEFVKSKVNNYHGTLDNEFKLDPNRHLFLTGDTDSASTYAGRRFDQAPTGKVEGFHAKDGKTLDLNDTATREKYVREAIGQNKNLKKYYDKIPESVRNDYYDTLGWVMGEYKAGRIPKSELDNYTKAQQNFKNISSKDVYANWDKIIAKAKKDGYDYITHTTEDPSAEITFPETVALNPSKSLISKQQLTDLYNQAHTQPTAPKVAAPQPTVATAPKTAKSDHWTTPIKGEPKGKMPNVKDTNGIQPQEGDVIEFPGVLGNKGRATVHWQEPHIANASGKRIEGSWVGNGALREDSPIPFTIVERNGKLLTQKPMPNAAVPALDSNNINQGNTPSSEITIAPAKPKTSAAVPPTPPTPPTQPKLTPPDNGGILPPKNGTMIGGGPTKKQGTTRYARKTVKESEFVSEQIKKDIKPPTYDLQTEKARYTDSLSRLKSEGADNFEVSLNERLQAPNGKISAQDVADAQAYAAVLDMRGDKLSLEKATVIYEKLSEHLTAAGQTIQAAAILSRRSPEGMRYWATKQLNQANVKLTPELQSELNTLIQAAKKAKDKQRATFEVQKFVDSHIPSSLGDRIINLWRAGLLTAPTTTGGNLLGNTGETLVRKGFVNPVATASDALMSMITGKRTMTLGKAGAGAKGVGEGISTLPEYLRTGYDPRQMQSKLDVKKELNYGNGKLGKALNTYVNGVYRLMGTADAPFSTLAEKEALSSIAKAEAINRGLKGAERSAFVSNFMENPPMAALERAAKEADYATFKNKTKLGQAAAGAKRPLGALGDFIIPFTQVPASIAMRLIDRTPIGIGKEIVSQIVAHKNGAAFDQRAMAQAIGNGTFGVVAIGAGMALAKTGDLTFGYPTDEKERKLWEMQGKQPYSVKVGNRWYSLNYLQPFGMLLSIGGQAEQDRKEGKNWQETTLASLGRAGQSINEQSFLKGVNTVTSAVADPERSMEKVMDSTAGSLVPNFIGSATRAADPVQRKTGSLTDAIKSDIPGLRGQVPEKNDVFGNPIPAKDNFANQYLNPLKPSIARSNPLVDQLAKLQAEGNGVMPTQTKDIGNVKLSKKQQAELSRMSGQLTEAKWKELTQSSDFAALNSDQKKKALSSLGEDANAVQKKQFGIANNLKTSNLTARQRAIAGAYDDPSGYARKAVDGDSSAYSGTFSKRHEPLYKDASKLVPNGLNPLPKNTEVLSLYDQFRIDFGKATSDLKKRDLQKEFIGNAYKTDLTSAGRELFSANYNSKQKIDALNRGEISQDELSKAIAIDNYLYANGLSSKRYIPQEVRYAFGYSSGGSGGSRGRGRTAKGGRRKSKVSSIVMPTYSTANRKMQSLLKSTRA